MVRRNPWIEEIFARFEAVALPDAYVVAGCVAQTVWNLAAGREAGAGIRDIDLVYFDGGDVSAEGEAAQEARLRGMFGHFEVVLDVKNQARVHQWYGRRFGREIGAYRSSAEAIGTYPATATCVGVRPGAVCAPFGLGDLADGVARPNKVLVSREVYEGKAARWAREWPHLRVIGWEDAGECAKVAVHLGGSP